MGRRAVSLAYDVEGPNRSRRMAVKKTLMILVMSITSAVCGTADSKSNDQQLINDAYDEWVKATNARDIERWSVFLAPEVLFLPPDHSALSTHDSIREYYLKLFADPNFSLRCRQRSVEVAASGDLAWSTGSCEASFSGPEGQRALGRSKWAKVWAKQRDGTWKARLNVWNSEAP